MKTRVGCFSSMIIIVLILIGINYISGIIDRKAEEEADRKRARVEEKIARKKAEIQNRKKQEQERLQRKDIKYYKANKKKVISQIKTYFSKGEYENALTVANKYISAEDPNLERLRSNVLKILQAKRELKREQEILTQLKTIPVSEYKRNLDLYRELEGIDPKNQLYKKKIAFYERKYGQEKERASCDLELLSWHWSTTSSGNYVTAEGEVKNISGRRLERVQAVVTWYDSSGNLITSDASTIQYSPLMRVRLHRLK
ncbi:MAG: FxLYD domain-containing protein [Deltaproteobacteria bacterium]|nr:FxLYD domain-containing protein [Deltaproteobacteria bacterium]